MIGKNVNLLKWFNFFYDFRPYVAIAIIYFSQISKSYALGFAVFSIASISSSIFEVPTGILSDQIGRRKTVIFGALASLFALLFYGLADSFLLLSIGAFFNGLARAFLSGNNNALLFDTLKEQDRLGKFSEKLGEVNAMTEIALGMSALISGFLAIYSFKMVMIYSIFPQIIALLISIKLIEPNAFSKNNSGNPFVYLKEALNLFVRNIKLRKISISYIVDSGLEQANYDFKPAFTALFWPTWAIGIARSLDSVFGFLGFRYAGRIIKTLGPSKTLFVQQIVGMVNRFVFIGLPSVFSPLMLSVNAFIYGVGETANQTLLHLEFSDKQRATMGSLNSLGSSLFYSLLMFLIGLIADSIGPILTLLLLTGLTTVVLPLYWNLMKQDEYTNKVIV